MRHIYLGKFETSRNHYVSDSMENLENATLLIKERFESAGLDVKLHNFTTSDTTTGQVCSVRQNLMSLPLSDYLYLASQ